MKNQSQLEPQQLFEQLKAGAKSSRTEKSLEIIHQICKEQSERGAIDFSYGTIGKFSEARGGPKAQPIRNVSGAAYRTLIDAWAKVSEGRARKPTRPAASSVHDDVLAMVADPVARVLVQSFISENKKLRNENAVLKVAAKDSLVIDLSGRASSRTGTVEIITPADLLLDQERAALRDAISAESMRKQGWTINEQNGAVNKGPLPVFSPGFVTAIRKIVGEVDA
jgi:type II secretory pathway component PulC